MQGGGERWRTQNVLLKYQRCTQEQLEAKNDIYSGLSGGERRGSENIEKYNRKKNFSGLIVFYLRDKGLLYYV
mgnify:CR=1 FL=1